jgi:hypothetical protein
MLDIPGTFLAARRIVELHETVYPHKTADGRAHVNWSSSRFASFRSAVSKPSVNEP